MIEWGADTFLAPEVPHKPARSQVPPTITVTKIKEIPLSSDLVIDVLSKACPACGGSLWWSPLPDAERSVGKRRPRSQWTPADFSWQCAHCTPPPSDEIVQAEADAFGGRQQEMRQQRLAHAGAALCPSCGLRPRRPDRVCLGLCFVCSTANRQRVREHAATCQPCRDTFFPRWREGITT